jgi:hypothetical protein
LKSRASDERYKEIRRLRAKVGEITMDDELVLERSLRVESEHGLRPGGAKRCPGNLGRFTPPAEVSSGCPVVLDRSRPVGTRMAAPTQLTPAPWRGAADPVPIVR